MTRSLRERRSPATQQTSATEHNATGSLIQKEFEEVDAPVGVMPFTVAFGDKEIICQHYGDPDTKPLLIFTHGAGGSLNNPTMKSFAAGFAATGSPVACFQGSMNLKNRTQSFRQVIRHVRKDNKDVVPLALGGLSMGARAAVMAAQDTTDISGLILVSYPLKNEKGDARDQILLELREDCDVLFVSGERDSMCDLQELSAVRQRMKARTWLVRVAGADHGMSSKPKDAVEPIKEAIGRVSSQWLHDRSTIADGMTIAWAADKTVVVQDVTQQPAKHTTNGKRAAQSASKPSAAKKAKVRKSRALS